jgi:hypothetical protein
MQELVPNAEQAMQLHAPIVCNLHALIQSSRPPPAIISSFDGRYMILLLAVMLERGACVHIHSTVCCCNSEWVAARVTCTAFVEIHKKAPSKFVDTWFATAYTQQKQEHC